MLTQQQKHAIPRLLIAWYREIERDLPWRKSNDPYKIWLSEIMLQQTRVEAAIPYYERFLASFPTLETLAEAEEEQVLKAWEGLGYYSRARNFHKAVREVATTYGGQVPSDEIAFRALPGVGAYTVGAVLSIAYGQALPAVDGNVLRVCSRLFLITESVDSARVKKQVEDIVRQLIPRDQASDFNQGLMELGALICIPRAPRCGQCPMANVCIAFAEGCQDKLPVKKKQREVPLVTFATGIVEKNGRYLVERRTNDGMMGGMWQFPTLEHGTMVQQELGNFVNKVAGTVVAKWQSYMEIDHTFTHVRWRLYSYRGSGEDSADESALSDDYRWVTIAEMEKLPFAGPHRKLRQALIAELHELSLF